MSERFTNPTERQKRAWEGLNDTLGELATAYGLDCDDVNELAGSAVEDAISRLPDDGRAA